MHAQRVVRNHGLSEYPDLLVAAQLDLAKQCGRVADLEARLELARQQTGPLFDQARRIAPAAGVLHAQTDETLADEPGQHARLHMELSQALRGQPLDAIGFSSIARTRF